VRLIINQVLAKHSFVAISILMRLNYSRVHFFKLPETFLEIIIEKGLKAGIFFVVN